MNALLLHECSFQGLRAQIDKRRFLSRSDLINLLLLRIYLGLIRLTTTLYTLY